MDTMVKEKDAAISRATNFEAEAEELEKTAQKFEKEVSEIQRKIAKVEDQLDITISSTKDPIRNHDFFWLLVSVGYWKESDRNEILVST